MDLKQFNLFQGAIQWAVDEDKRLNGLTYDTAKTSPLEHDQQMWAFGKIDKSVEPLTWEIGSDFKCQYLAICPTTGCVAGNIVLTAGEQFVVPQFASIEMMPQVPFMAEYCWSPENGFQEIRLRAEDLAGLTHDEATDLFEGANTLDKIVELAYKIADNHGYTLELV